MSALLLRRSLRVGMMAPVLALSSCAFMTTDVYRPLLVSTFPDEARGAELRESYFQGAESEPFLRSLDRTRAAWNYFGIQKYQSFYADLDIQRLVDAIELYPDNPFAWSQLGAYMALQHRAGAAAEATGRALEILDGLGDLSGASELEELKQTTVINLAIYHNSSAQHRAALAALARLDDPNALGGFHRVAYHWAAAQAFTGLGDVRSSRRALEKAHLAASEGLGPSPGEGDYPQYFRPRKRSAVFQYLEAANLRVEGRYDEAIAMLDAALEGPPDRSDGKLWDARFLRALAYKEQGNLSRARTELEDLIEAVPRKLFRREAIHYQLALVLIELDELLAAETELARAVEIVRYDNHRLRRILDDVASGGTPENPPAVSGVLETARLDEGWTFSPAFDALGQAYLDLMARTSKKGYDPRLAAIAEEKFEIAVGEHGFPRESDRRVPGPRAARGGPGKTGLPLVPVSGEDDARLSARVPGSDRDGRKHVTLARLGSLYWTEGVYDRSLERYDQALRSAPGYTRGFESLVELGSRASEPELARQAYALVLDYLPIEAAPFGVETQLGTSLSAALADDPQAGDSEELAHLRARLLLLRGELNDANAAFRAAERVYDGALWPIVGQAWVELNRPEPQGTAVAARLGERLVAAGSSAKPWERRDAYFVRGELRLSLLDPAGALEDFRAASALAPDWGLAREGVELAEKKSAQAASAASEN